MGFNKLKVKQREILFIWWLQSLVMFSFRHKCLFFLLKIAVKVAGDLPDEKTDVGDVTVINVTGKSVDI